MSETSVTFRVRGWGRWLVVAFLLAWIAGWGAGEWFALRVLTTRPTNWVIAGFLLLWFILWTIGGVFAITQTLRLIAGRDCITFTPTEVIVWRGVGPFGIERRFPRTDVDDLFVRANNGPLMLDSNGKQFRVSSYGTIEERRDVIARFWTAAKRADLLPRRWITTREANGRIRVTRRGFESPGCLLFVAIAPLFVAMFAIVAGRGLGWIGIGVVWAIVLGLVALALWGAFSRRAWIVGPNYAARETRWFSWERVTVLDPRSLRLDDTTDSDGDQTFFLRGTSRGKSITIYSDLNDDRDVRALAEFFAETTGWRV